MTVKSPCTDVCQFDPRSHWCAGCGRTGEEIKSWRKMTPYRQRVVLGDLGRRMMRLRAEADAGIVRPAAKKSDRGS